MSNIPTQSQWSPLQCLKLVDGRTLTYRKIGDPDGTPVLFFHGTPGTHTLAFVAEEAARKYGYCVIAPDRPGMGDSDYQPERELRHWPLDIAQLLHHLNIKECGIIAISGGAPYALQCGYDLPNQITFLACLSGWLSFGRKEAQGVELHKATKQLQHLLLKLKWLHPLIGRLITYVIRKKPNKILEHLKTSLPEADLKILNENHAARELFMSDLQNGYKQGHEGAVTDGQLQFSDPQWPISRVEQPVILLHGTHDTVAPYAMSEAMNHHLPNVVDFITIEKGGHLCAIPEIDRVFDKILNLSVT